MMKDRSWLLWVIAFLLPLSTAFFQRITGSSYLIGGKRAVGAAEVAFRLLRRPTDRRCKRTHQSARWCGLPCPYAEQKGFRRPEVPAFRSSPTWSPGRFAWGTPQPCLARPAPLRRPPGDFTLRHVCWTLVYRSSSSRCLVPGAGRAEGSPGGRTCESTSW